MLKSNEKVFGCWLLIINMMHNTVCLIKVAPEKPFLAAYYGKKLKLEEKDGAIFEVSGIFQWIVSNCFHL